VALGEDLRRLRKAAYRNCADIAALCGCDARTIVDIEDGKIVATRAIYEKLVEQFSALSSNPPAACPAVVPTSPSSNPHVEAYKRRMRPFWDLLRRINVGMTNKKLILDLVLMARHSDLTDQEITDLI